MAPHGFAPREGGVKVVFDVPEAEAHDVALQVTGSGFEVHRYYHPDDEHRHGGSKPGYIRLGAECAMTDFTEAEQVRIVADFDAAQTELGFTCARIGTDVWTAGGGRSAGDREPRVPLPKAGAGAAYAGQIDPNTETTTP